MDNTPQVLPLPRFKPGGGGHNFCLCAIMCGRFVGLGFSLDFDIPLPLAHSGPLGTPKIGASGLGPLTLV